MKSSTFTIIKAFLILSLFLIISCQKEELEVLDPATDINAISRALLINGQNIKGEPDFEANITGLSVDSYQRSASITGDNYLFVPFIYSNPNNDMKYAYFFLEGADNFWKIPVSDNTDKTQVLNIGIPENVQAGNMVATYGLLDAADNSSNSVNMDIGVVLPEDYCEYGASSEWIEGQDGLTNRRFLLDKNPGWVTIEFDTYNVPDRIDVRYNYRWIRSSGALLSDGYAPPIKLCDKVTADDGFKGQRATFAFYHVPETKKGSLLDVYMSGCIGGGTEWKFRLLECPTEKPVLGVHSTEPPDGQLGRGHNWITIEHNGKTNTHALWPDWNPAIEEEKLNNGSGSDLRTNFGPDWSRGLYSRYYPLTDAELQKLNTFVTRDQQYCAPIPGKPDFGKCSSWNVCTTFAQDLVEYVTGERIPSDELFNGLNVESPRQMSRGIIELEKRNPTGTYSASQLPVKDSNSLCSFCE